MHVLEINFVDVIEDVKSRKVDNDEQEHNNSEQEAPAVGNISNGNKSFTLKQMFYVLRYNAPQFFHWVIHFHQVKHMLLYQMRKTFTFPKKLGQICSMMFTVIPTKIGRLLHISFAFFFFFFFEH